MDSVITIHSFLFGQSLIKALLSLFICMLGGKEKNLSDNAETKPVEMK